MWLAAATLYLQVDLFRLVCSWNGLLQPWISCTTGRQSELYLPRPCEKKDYIMHESVCREEVPRERLSLIIYILFLNLSYNKAKLLVYTLNSIIPSLIRLVISLF